MNNRIRKVKSLFSQYNIDALLVSADVNIKYLTGFNASESWLLITPKKSFYITDSRYTLEARQGLKGVSVLEYKLSIFQGLADAVRAARVKRIGVDENHFTVAQYKQLKHSLSSSKKLVRANCFIEKLREIKDKSEVDQIRKALRLHAKTLKYLRTIVKPGKTELEILRKLENYVKSREAGFSFDPIIASGPNSCHPHAHVTKRKIHNNEPVLIDMGIDIGGYKSDLTRMFVLGKISNLIENTITYVREAQLCAIETIRDGVKASDVDAAARDFLKSKKQAKYFGHGLGHGVGLDIHEAPRLSPLSKTVLKEGMVITVEPGVYYPNKFGVRLEEMVLVKKNGCEVLSGSID